MPTRWSRMKNEVVPPVYKAAINAMVAWVRTIPPLE
jgi:hypothetical protein